MARTSTATAERGQTLGLNGAVAQSYFGQVDDDNLTEHAQAAVNEYRDAVRRAIVEDGRIEILVEEVLGYTLKPFHARLLLSQDNAVKVGEFYWSLILGFRGSGKSTVSTVARVVYEIVRNPNIRILIASNTNLQAEVFLREIKAHFESNPRFREIFGTEWQGDKWGGSEITVGPRTTTAKESTVTCIGVGGPTASRHYDLIIADDLADEENSRTALQRLRLLTWFNKTLLPTLEPGGRIWVSGTCWHPEDLYAHLEKTIVGLKPCKVKAIQDDGTSPWPEKFPVDHFLALRQTIGVPEFESQYQMNTAAMTGKIFSYDMFHWYEDNDVPEGLRIFQGVDLAIGQKETSDYYANATVGDYPATKHKYVLDVYKRRLRFKGQTEDIRANYAKHDPILCGIESNAYQAAQVQNLQDEDHTMRLRPVYTHKDKVTRAMKMAARCERGEILFNKRRHVDLIATLLKFPDVDHDDDFDAVEIAIDIATRGVKKRRPSDAADDARRKPA